MTNTEAILALIILFEDIKDKLNKINERLDKLEKMVSNENT